MQKGRKISVVNAYVAERDMDSPAPNQPLFRLRRQSPKSPEPCQPLFRHQHRPLKLPAPSLSLLRLQRKFSKSAWRVYPCPDQAFTIATTAPSQSSTIAATSPQQSPTVALTASPASFVNPSALQFLNLPPATAESVAPCSSLYTYPSPPKPMHTYDSPCFQSATEYYLACCYPSCTPTIELQLLHDTSGSILDEAQAAVQQVDELPGSASGSCSPTCLIAQDQNLVMKPYKTSALDTFSSKYELKSDYAKG
ncbi:uncharacterized protein M437DRAFT_64735 [Aureobasidium melanogenum CBS 110374]|uniref:Uncharacterized protein n=1 Tax=Aureobasidium melanogenum (strain CBS 110374) TaxID=1043003 RepID=A0A074W2N9_AURM1|nr:uncharacterized protein M437DRAFT_64735 [Aureobasidium melanogenum CBS 110374]KEQ64177.1 hypothetical protein M437DRAFT_64735 [Aureobasidium melanogenum CBS 110374]